MDWFLSATTVGINMLVGWRRGAWWALALVAVNAAVWIYYAGWMIDQPGLIPASLVSIAMNVPLAVHRYREAHA